jgi:hypothetical protein
MSAAKERYVWAREALFRAALDSLRAERRLSDEGSDVLTTTQADGRLAIAARDFARAMESLPVVMHPKGWGE